MTPQLANRRDALFKFLLTSDTNVAFSETRRMQCLIQGLFNKLTVHIQNGITNGITNGNLSVCVYVPGQAIVAHG